MTTVSDAWQRERELQVHLEEFKALKAEIAANQLACRQSTYLAILVATSIAAAAVAWKASAPFPSEVYVFAPAFFLILQLAQIRYTHLTLAIGQYIQRDLASKIGRLLRTEDLPFAWEHQSAEPGAVWRGYTRIAAGATGYFPLLAAAGTGVLGAFQKNLQAWHVVILVVELLLWGLCVLAGRSAVRTREPTP